MKHTLRFVLCAVVWLATAFSISAALQIRISDGTPAGTITVTDQSPDDFNLSVGSVSYSGPVGVNWSASLSTGTTKPVLSTAAVPRMDVQTFNVSSANGGNLTIELTDTDYIGTGPAVLSIGGNSAGQITFNSYTDNGNVGFAKTALIAALGPFSGNFGQNAAAVVNALPPYSITFKLAIVHPGRGITGLDAELVINNARFLVLPSRGERQYVMLVDDVIRYCLREVFPTDPPHLLSKHRTRLAGKLAPEEVQLHDTLGIRVGD